MANYKLAFFTLKGIFLKILANCTHILSILKCS
jgi:hypothetical protein